VPEPYPHNIFLTSWTELGLLGLAAFTWILVTLLIRPWMALSRASGIYRTLLWGTGTGFAMLTIHGMVDSPYWKNDLSLEFWIVAALEVVALMAVRLNGQTPAPSAGSRLAEPK
jgi:O-antigen ligase